MYIFRLVLNRTNAIMIAKSRYYGNEISEYFHKKLVQLLECFHKQLYVDSWLNVEEKSLGNAQ